MTTLLVVSAMARPQHARPADHDDAGLPSAERPRAALAWAKAHRGEADVPPAGRLGRDREHLTVGIRLGLTATEELH